MEVSCQEQIIHATKEVENALRSAALLSLKREKNPRPSKHRNKKWFDNDLHNKRKQLIMERSSHIILENLWSVDTSSNLERNTQNWGSLNLNNINVHF